MTAVNTNFIVKGFNNFLSGTDVLGILFNTVSIIVVFLYVITIVRIYSKTMVGEQLKVSEMLRPFAVLLIIVFWRWIYFDILVAGFDALTGLLVNTMDESALRNEELYAKMKDNAMGESISLMDLSIESCISFVMKFLAVAVNTILDIAIALYVGVNDLILGLIAPVAIAFMMLEETKAIFTKWLMTFIVFRLYLLLTILTNYLAVQLLGGIASAIMQGDVGQQMALGGGVAEAALAATSVIGLLGYIIFKLIFLLSSYKILNTLFTVGDSGVGAGAAGLSGSIVKGAKMVATKGTGK